MRDLVTFITVRERVGRFINRRGGLRIKSDYPGEINPLISPAILTLGGIERSRPLLRWVSSGTNVNLTLYGLVTPVSRASITYVTRGNARSFR